MTSHAIEKLLTGVPELGCGDLIEAVVDLAGVDQVVPIAPTEIEGD